MNKGLYISAGAHAGLVAYVLLGGFFVKPNDTEPLQTQEVSLISEADFASLSRVETSPDVPTIAPEIRAPEVDVAALSNPVQSQPDTSTPTVPSQPSAADTAPSEPAPLSPPVRVDPTPPSPTNDPEISLEDPGAGLPDIANRPPKPRPVPRIAPEAVMNPDKTPDIADQLTPKVSPDAEQTAEVKPDEPTAAPKEATTEIVTEAETPSGMSTSPRPKSRPQSIATQVAQKADDQAKAQADEAKAEAEAKAAADAAATAAADAIVALAAASADTPAAPDRPTGPPMSAGEKDALRVAVQQCWNTGSMSTEAQRTAVTVGVSMNNDGTPIAGTIKLLSPSGVSSAAAQQAFQTARRAIIICGKRGYQLPVEKYDQWREIEITFDPEQMRFK